MPMLSSRDSPIIQVSQEIEVEDPLQAEREATCDGRQNITIILTVSPDLVPLIGGGRSTNRSDMLSSLIEAADTTLTDATRSAI